MSLVPITINPHLVSFFFKESDSNESVYECTYGNKRVKPVLFAAASSIARIIRLLMEKADMPQKVENFNLVLTVSDTDTGSKKYTGEFYKFVNGRNSWLMLPAEANNDINDLLEDIFRMAFMSYISGCAENNDEACILYAIDKFIDKYDLLEFGFSRDSMRRQYYREKNNNKIIARFQKYQSPNRANFCG